jgi:hypothetical protein
MRDLSVKNDVCMCVVTGNAAVLPAQEVPMHQSPRRVRTARDYTLQPSFKD